MSISPSSADSQTKSKGGVIQPGTPVTACYGPYNPEVCAGKKNRTRTEIRGVVLSSHSENNWLVHWIPVERNAHAPFNRLKVDHSATAVSREFVSELLEENKDNYLGGPEELRNYVNNFMTTATPQKKRAAPVAVTTSTAKIRTKKHSALRSKPPPFTQLSVEPSPTSASTEHSASSSENVAKGKISPILLSWIRSCIGR